MNTIKVSSKGILFILINALSWGLLAHGMMFFNKYSFHDENVGFNGIGATYTSGRWMLGIMGTFWRKLTGTKHYSLPILNGIITILCIGILLYLLFDILDIHNRIMQSLICGIFVSFPAVTAVFGFMFTAPYYYFAALMGVAGVYLYYRYHNWISIIGCMTLMACSVGTYQANLPVCACSLLLLLIQTTWLSDGKWSAFFKESVKSLLILIGSLAEYYLINKAILAVKDISLSDYQGISTFGKTSLKGYCLRILRAYREFLNPSRNTTANMYPFHSRYFHIALIAVCFILLVILVIHTFRTNAKKAVQLFLLTWVYPLAAYLIYVMVSFPNIHSLMTFGEAYTFLLAVWICKNCCFPDKPTLLIKKASIALIALLLLMNIRLSNICYIKAGILQSQAVSYFTTLIAEIKSINEYTNETPIIYINELEKEEENLPGTDIWFTETPIIPYDVSSVINDYDWKNFMALWCNFRPAVPAFGDAFTDSDIVKSMPAYPDHGSIRYLDGCIIVKFA